MESNEVSGKIFLFAFYILLLFFSLMITLKETFNCVIWKIGKPENRKCDIIHNACILYVSSLLLV